MYVGNLGFPKDGTSDGDSRGSFGLVASCRLWYRAGLATSLHEVVPPAPFTAGDDKNLGTSRDLGEHEVDLRLRRVCWGRVEDETGEEERYDTGHDTKRGNERARGQSCWHSQPT